MRLKTIWTIPAMTFRDRFRETGDWAARTAAARLPKRVRYWAFIHVGVRSIPLNAVVPEISFMNVLQRAEGGPK